MAVIVVVYLYQALGPRCCVIKLSHIRGRRDGGVYVVLGFIGFKIVPVRDRDAVILSCIIRNIFD